MKTMNKLFFLSVFTLCNVMTLTQTNQALKESAVDIDNSTTQLMIRNLAVGTSTELSISKTFVQYGKRGNNYVLRFATAVSGDIENITYTRIAEGKDDNVLAVSSVYEGLTSGEDVVYYNSTTEDITTDETYKGQYYWACYTIEYASAESYDLDITISAKITDAEGNYLESTPKVTSLSTLLNADKQEYVIDGQIVADTYVASNSSSAKTADNSEKPTLGTYSNYYRTYFKFNFSNILENPDFEAFKDSGKIQFKFAIAKGDANITETTKFTFKGFTPGDGVSNVEFSNIYWNNVTSTGTYPKLHWNESEYIFNGQTQGENIACADGVIVFTLDYNQVSSYISTDTKEAVFVLMIPGTSGISLSSMENTEFAHPSVSFVYNK